MRLHLYLFTDFFQKLAAELTMPYISTSSKTTQNVNEVFFTLAKLLVEKREAGEALATDED